MAPQKPLKSPEQIRDEIQQFIKALVEAHPERKLTRSEIQEAFRLRAIQKSDKNPTHEEGLGEKEEDQSESGTVQESGEDRSEYVTAHENREESEEEANSDEESDGRTTRDKSNTTTTYVGPSAEQIRLDIQNGVRGAIQSQNQINAIMANMTIAPPQARPPHPMEQVRVNIQDSVMAIAEAESHAKAVESAEPNDASSQPVRSAEQVRIDIQNHIKAAAQAANRAAAGLANQSTTSSQVSAPSSEVQPIRSAEQVRNDIQGAIKAVAEAEAHSRTELANSSAPFGQAQPRPAEQTWEDIDRAVNAAAEAKFRSRTAGSGNSTSTCSNLHADAIAQNPGNSSSNSIPPSKSSRAKRNMPLEDNIDSIHFRRRTPEEKAAYVAGAEGGLEVWNAQVETILRNQEERVEHRASDSNSSQRRSGYAPKNWETRRDRRVAELNTPGFQAQLQAWEAAHPRLAQANRNEGRAAASSPSTSSSTGQSISGPSFPPRNPITSTPPSTTAQDPRPTASLCSSTTPNHPTPPPAYTSTPARISPSQIHAAASIADRFLNSRNQTTQGNQDSQTTSGAYGQSLGQAYNQLSAQHTNQNFNLVSSYNSSIPIGTPGYFVIHGPNGPYRPMYGYHYPEQSTIPYQVVEPIVAPLAVARPSPTVPNPFIPSPMVANGTNIRPPSQAPRSQAPTPRVTHETHPPQPARLQTPTLETSPPRTLPSQNPVLPDSVTVTLSQTGSAGPIYVQNQGPSQVYAREGWYCASCGHYLGAGSNFTYRPPCYQCIYRLRTPAELQAPAPEMPYPPWRY